MEDKNELKIIALREALRERVSTLTDEYENRIVDLRIEITEAHFEIEKLREALHAAMNPDQTPVEGTVVSHPDDASVPE